MTHDGNANGAIGQEVVVKSGQVSSTTGLELDLKLGFDSNGILALDDVQDCLLLLVDLIALGIQVLDDVGWAVEACCGGDVVQRRVWGQRGRVWHSQKLFVHRLQRHGE